MFRIALTLAVLGAFSSLASTPPTVSNVLVSSIYDTPMKHIAYDLSDPDGDLQTITILLSFDGGETWPHSCTSVYGDVGPGIVPGEGKSVYWNVIAEFPDLYATDCVVMVVADDGTSAGAPAGFVYCAPGLFQMGSPVEEPGHLSDEPLHWVQLTHGFYAQENEVTNSEYAVAATWALQNGYAVISGPYLVDPWNLRDLVTINGALTYSPGDTSIVVAAGEEDRTVVRVTWFGAAAYSDWLNAMQGLPLTYDHNGLDYWYCLNGSPYGAVGYRLPTESEWEYFCRATTSTAYWSGPSESDLADVGWYVANSGGHLQDVGLLPANLWGLHDIHGNAWEWCNDVFYDYPYTPGPDEPSVDPYYGPSAGRYPIIRGGPYSLSATWCRSAKREFCADRATNVGFRLVRTQY